MIKILGTSLAILGLIVSLGSSSANARPYRSYRSYSSHTTVINNHYGYHGGGFGSAFIGGMAGAAVGNALTHPYYGGYGYGGYGYPAPVVAAPPVVVQSPPQQVIVQQPPQVIIQQPQQTVVEPQR